MLKSRKELVLLSGIGVNPEKRVGMLGDVAAAGSRKIWHCILCWEHGSSVADIVHKPDCILASASVTHVRMSAMRSRIVFHQANGIGRYWWISSSGRTYDIKRCGEDWWIMTCRSSAAAVMGAGRLSDIRSWLREHQGEL